MQAYDTSAILGGRPGGWYPTNYRVRQLAHRIEMILQLASAKPQISMVPMPIRPSVRPSVRPLGVAAMDGTTAPSAGGVQESAVMRSVPQDVPDGELCKERAAEGEETMAGDSKGS